MTHTSYVSIIDRFARSFVADLEGTTTRTVIVSSATNDSHAPSAEQLGHEDDQAQEQESNPETQPEETSPTAEQPPTPSPEPANDNSPSATAEAI
jgi:hypothetical protein